MSSLSNHRRLAVPLAIVRLLVCAAVVGASALVPTGIAAATAPSLVSGSCDGGPANGNSHLAAVSADGQFVAFYSDGTNLVPGDTNGQPDAFIRDRASGAVELLNVSSDGQIGNHESAHPRPSGDGRYVTFHSLASNLVPGDSNERPDVFVRDRVLGTTERVSVCASDGSEANAGSGGQVITPDGRYVVFVTGASNLSPLDIQSDTLDIYLHDRQTSETELVSLAQDGTRPYIFESQNPSVSDDGRYIVFESRAQLVADDTNYDSDVYVQDDSRAPRCASVPLPAAAMRTATVGSGSGTASQAMGVTSPLSPDRPTWFPVTPTGGRTCSSTARPRGRPPS